jgi:hypothetical protein
MLYDEQFIPELNIFYHRHDDINKNYVDYENVILNKSLSSYIYNNNLMSGFLNFLNKLVSLYFDSFNIVKNFPNYMVDKYFYKHSN